jgi:hypothetical protein
MALAIQRYYYGTADEVEIEIVMNEGSMPPMVLALVAAKRAARVHKEMKDLEVGWGGVGWGG